MNPDGGRGPSPDGTDVLVGDVVWCGEKIGSMEHCSVLGRHGGWTIGSTAVLTIEGAPGHIVARIHVDDSWNTETVLVEVHARQPRRVEIAVRDGEWTVDGARRRDLDGCRDVDLGWTPATNLLPLRRLGLPVGDEDVVQAAWLRYPEFELERIEQSYRRLGERRWRYRSGTADHVLDVDDVGLVTRYGDGLWIAVSSPE